MTDEERRTLAMLGFFETCWIRERGAPWSFSFNKLDQAIELYKIIILVKYKETYAT